MTGFLNARTEILESDTVLGATGEILAEGLERGHARPPEVEQTAAGVKGFTTLALARPG